MTLPKLLLALLALTPCAALLPDEPAPAGPIAYTAEIMPAFHVKDLAKAQRWYAEVLGFEVVYELAEQGWCELATPSEDAKLGLSQNPATRGSCEGVVSCGVQDMAAAKAQLVQHAVALEGDVVEIPGVVKLLYFRDPDANQLMFFQALQPATKPAEAGAR